MQNLKYRVAKWQYVNGMDNFKHRFAFAWTTGRSLYSSLVIALSKGKRGYKR